MLFLASYLRLLLATNLAKVFRTSVSQLGVYLNDESKIDFMTQRPLLSSRPQEKRARLTQKLATRGYVVLFF